MNDREKTMIEAGEVRLGGCICEPYSDRFPNWMDMRSELEYILIYAISVNGIRGYES